MHIKDLCKQAHKMACEKGFWWDCQVCHGKKKYYSYGVLKNCELCTPTGKFRRNLSELLMLITSELGEACEALRNNDRQIRSKNEKWRKSDGWQKDTFEDEICDAVIRICDLAESQGIDLEWQIEQKMAYNKTRPEKHGKKFKRSKESYSWWWNIGTYCTIL